ncbi:GreA/GreB family elongation factor [Bradyrhizobium sp. TZ2]
MSEIQRAVVCDTHNMPRGVASLNRWVTYRVDGSNEAESRILVCPDEFRSAQINLSVLSPLGAAVLGMSVGDRMMFVSIDGGLHCVVVESLQSAGKRAITVSLEVTSIGPTGSDRATWAR